MSSNALKAMDPVVVRHLFPSLWKTVENLDRVDSDRR